MVPTQWSVEQWTLDIVSFHSMWHNVIVSSFNPKDHKHLIAFFDAVHCTWWACKGLGSTKTYQDIYTGFMKFRCTFKHTYMKTFTDSKLKNVHELVFTLHWQRWKLKVFWRSRENISEERKHFRGEKTFLRRENMGKLKKTLVNVLTTTCPLLLQPYFLCVTFMT